MRERSVLAGSLVVASLAVAAAALVVPARGLAAEEPPGLAEPNPENPPFVRRWKRDRLEDWYDQREDVRDRREDIFDRREDVRDRRDDRFKARAFERLRRERREALESGDTDRAEALGERLRGLRGNIARDRREDIFDRREDRRDRREDFFDRREDVRDRRHGPPGYRRRPGSSADPGPHQGWRRPGSRHRHDPRGGIGRPGPWSRPGSPMAWRPAFHRQRPR